MMLLEETTALSYGRQDCSDFHSWGPGVRTLTILHFVVRGSGTYICQGKKHFVKAGESFLIRPYTQIAYYPDPDDPWEYVWVNFNGAFYQKLLDQIAFKQDVLIESIPKESILPYFEALAAAVEQSPLTADGLLRTLLGIYADTYPAYMAENPSYEQAKSLIETNFHRADFDLGEICHTLGVSGATLYRSFKRQGETSPGAYLAALRVERAKEFLKMGSTVKQTALSCGFRDALYFSKVFKASTGVSPSQYRKKCKNPLFF